MVTARNPTLSAASPRANPTPTAMATAMDMTGTRMSTLKFSAKAIPHKMHMIARLMIAGVNIPCPRVFITSEVIFIGQKKLPRLDRCDLPRPIDK